MYVRANDDTNSRHMFCMRHGIDQGLNLSKEGCIVEDELQSDRRNGCPGAAIRSR